MTYDAPPPMLPYPPMTRADSRDLSICADLDRGLSIHHIARKFKVTERHVKELADAIDCPHR